MMTPAHRARLRTKWRAIARAAETGDVDGLQAAADVLHWESPFTDKSPSFLLFGLARLVFAFLRGSQGERLRLVAVLNPAGRLAGEALDAIGVDLPPPALPFRADLDG